MGDEVWATSTAEGCGAHSSELRRHDVKILVLRILQAVFDRCFVLEWGRRLVLDVLALGEFLSQIVEAL